MDPRIETVMNEWRFRSCEPGYAGLHALEDAQFSGSVTADDATGFMVNGRLVGITNGSIESFWSSDIAALETDEPAEALLCAMLIADFEVEAEYYTGETPIAEVHETLASGNFSGYIELSENVFSGDYFVIYYGGTSKCVALLGTEERVISGDEALQRASDEVGIYEVKSVSITVIDLPDPEVDDSIREEEPVVESNQEVTRDDTEAAPQPVEEPTTQTPPEPEPQNSPRPPSQPPSGDPIDPADPNDLATLAEAARGGDAAAVSPSRTTDSDPLKGDGEWITIPSIDPNNTTIYNPENESEDAEAEQPSDTQEMKQTVDQPPNDDHDIHPNHAELQAELDAAKRENERLRNRVEELQDRIEEFEEDSSSSELLADDAFSQTNLFVRYQSKGGNTLADAVAGNATDDRALIKENIRLERHTRFEVDDVTIEGTPFVDFLESSLEYRFASWLLQDLLFELQDAGLVKGFKAVVDVIPEIDRVQFHGTVPIHTESQGERRSEQFNFDIVFRDSMGAVLLVANVHDDRAPVEGEPVEEMLSQVNEITLAKSTLSGAFYVTKSYFEPAVLETVAEATSGGLLRGSSRESYVSVSRKHGFHLCLVEARNSTFHLNVPDS